MDAKVTEWYAHAIYGAQNTRSGSTHQPTVVGVVRPSPDDYQQQQQQQQLQQQQQQEAGLSWSQYELFDSTEPACQRYSMANNTQRPSIGQTFVPENWPSKTSFSASDGKLGAMSNLWSAPPGHQQQQQQRENQLLFVSCSCFELG
jgi:hypothetical protein